MNSKLRFALSDCSFARENGSSRDWVALYCSAFDKEERQPVADVRELIAKGRIALFTARHHNKIIAFALVSLHNEQETQFANLDFIAVCKDLRGKHGIGTKLVGFILERLRAEHPSFTSMTIEISRRGEPGLTPEEEEHRQARARFYSRLGASQLDVDYYILSFDDPNYRGPAEFWAIPLRQAAVKAQELVFNFYTSEAGYGLPADHVAVKEVMSQFIDESKGR